MVSENYFILYSFINGKYKTMILEIYFLLCLVIEEILK